MWERERGTFTTSATGLAWCRFSTIRPTSWGELPEKAAELKRLLAAWRDEVGARLPVPNPAFAGR